MKIKTSELSGKALDYVVALCEGRDKTYLDYFGSQWHLNKSLCYSSNWSQGGPIIERARIELLPAVGGYLASHYTNQEQSYIGNTLLIAAMRCYVALKLGDSVDIPDELL